MRVFPPYIRDRDLRRRCRRVAFARGWESWLGRWIGRWVFRDGFCCWRMCMWRIQLQIRMLRKGHLAKLIRNVLGDSRDLVQSTSQPHVQCRNGCIPCILSSTQTTGSNGVMKAMLLLIWCCGVRLGPVESRWGLNQIASLSTYTWTGLNVLNRLVRNQQFLSNSLAVSH
jgi:hypothetical protein